MKAEYSITLYKDAMMTEGILTFFWTDKNEASLTYKCNGQEYSAMHKYPFWALTKIRENIEIGGGRLLCNGSRIDVYPSGMSALGILAYEIVMGKPATKLVSIFDSYTQLNKIVTVEDQKANFEKWLVSL